MEKLPSASVTAQWVASVTYAQESIQGWMSQATLMGSAFSAVISSEPPAATVLFRLPFLVA